ncbi:SDR family oxidoreductase [Vitiosangium sp. GDMCC 1.1324]|uniref:SDR family oxidoreductase n=1 Tax=Vitiosangium sp. (strain GDMCC 1.1324) TaxID=2138576 RepID=UPI000D343956|nr:SDR family oxidoreductase [Vitiosangium sp. GDMCC 1.1324]PTL82802.1 short-chain dehydrogenase [Vitiosangium sp. GDMCC 1.1324]
MKEALVITGASKGIGLATAELFLQRGATVVNLSRSRCELEGVVNLMVDLTVAGFERGVEAPLLQAIAGCERLVLIHNAAVLEQDTADAGSLDVLRRALEVEVVAPTVLNRLLIPRMPRGSSVIYVGSTLSEKGVPGIYSYVVAKHANVGMMRATCQDLLGRGVHTVCVCPGVTDTETLQKRVAGDAQTLEVLRSITGEGRLIEPEEIAQVIAFAADHPVLNGTLLHANLGQKEH